MANAISIRKQGPGGLGNKHVLILDATIDTYASGGIALDVPSAYAGAVAFVQASSGYEGCISDGKLMLYQAGTEVSTLASAITVSVMFVA